jgi:Zn-dependent protease with chaperone function
MAGVQATTTRTCPNCGNEVPVDPAFITWCDRCDWNLEGTGRAAPEVVDSHSAAAVAAGRRLFASLEGSEVTRPGTSGARVASYAVAVVIHLVSFSIFVLGVVVLVTSFPQIFAFVAGIPLILLAILLRPQLGGIRSGTVILPRAAAPALYGLVDRIGSTMGAHPVEVIALDSRFNASYARVGVRGRRVVWIGLALWNVLSEQQRVAVLGHELAHQVNGDSTQGVVVGSALRTLGEWHQALDSPDWQPQPGSVAAGIEAIAQLLAAQAMKLPRAGVRALFRFERSLLYQSSQRAEYFADMLAARAASTEAMIGALDALYIADPCSGAVRFAARRGETDIWAAEQKFFLSITPREWERYRRIETRDGTAIDATHPPTNLRIELQSSKAAQPAAISVTSDEWKAIAAEIGSGFALVASQLEA